MRSTVLDPRSWGAWWLNATCGADDFTYISSRRTVDLRQGILGKRAYDYVWLYGGTKEPAALTEPFFAFLFAAPVLAALRSRNPRRLALVVGEGAKL